MKQLERLLQKYNYSISNYAPFFTSSFIEDYDRTDLTIYEADEIQQFKGNSQFKECYMFDENYPDLLGTAIKNGKEIIAMAGMNQTGKYCLELGVQVLPEYRHQGLATKLITAITVEAQQRYPKMVVTYGTQFTHTQSINVAIKSGFNHQWTEIMINSK